MYIHLTKDKLPSASPSGTKILFGDTLYEAFYGLYHVNCFSYILSKSKTFPILHCPLLDKIELLEEVWDCSMRCWTSIQTTVYVLYSDRRPLRQFGVWILLVNTVDKFVIHKKPCTCIAEYVV